MSGRLSAGALLCACVALLAGCTQPASEPAQTLFVERSPEDTGVAFENRLVEDESFNILRYLYFYNGAGVAVGDVDGNGLPDVYLASNQDPNRLYLNRGDFTFEDVTETAGVAGSADWTTGVTMADVNGDGHLDLYVSALSGYEGQAGRNELFINDGTGRFSEQAEAFGLDFAGYSTQAYFFDYDGDHDLDLYLLNHSTHTERTLGRAFLRDQPHPTAGDRLFRNDDGQFTDVTLDAGLYSGSIGYGLSASVTDLDGNGCTDLYVANDFHENDYVYLNQCDGTFRESVRESMPHTSQFSMGTDAGDVNGDGRMDLVVLDMLPEDELTRQTSETAEAYDIYQLKRRFGYHHQHGRNTLQLNAGLDASGVPAFQDAAYLAGLEATDWSWGALFGDYDLDGRQDVFITNGILRRPNDLDYLNFHSNAAVQASLQADEGGNDLELVEKMPSVPVPNYAFRNEGRLGMANVSATWGLDHVGFSTGVAHGDLDGDGDLDLIVSHVNEPVSLYQNTAVENGARPALHLTLEGPAGNPYGLGTRVTLVADSASTAFDVYPTRGWLSSSEPAVITGTASDSVDVRVVWPGGETQEQRISGSGRTSLAYEPTGRTRPIDVQPDPDLAGELGLEFTHVENTFVDFNRELLMPEKVSMEGPALAVGDVDGDGLDDVFIGGAKYQAGALFVQQTDGAFAVSEQPALVADSLHEDVDALWFDADGDLDVDLYVVSAGNEFWGQNAGLADRFYRNEDGLLVRDRAALPEWYENGGAVAAGDADGDGDLDLFVGGRVKARAYGEWPQSILLVNNGSGVFVDETSTRAPDLAEVGLVTDAVWADVLPAEGEELVLVGEWIAPTIFARTQEGGLERADVGLESATGLWRFVTTADLDGDGDMDLLLGNAGLNQPLRASATDPVRMHVADFDQNGSVEQLVTYTRDEAPYLGAMQSDLRKQFVELRKQYTTFTSFGARTYEELFEATQRARAETRRVQELASSWAENDGAGQFVLHRLPDLAQLSPLFTTVILAPGDLLAAGNFTGTKPSAGRYDAGVGVRLRFTTDAPSGDVTAVRPNLRQLDLRGEVRELARIRRPEMFDLLVVASNDSPIRAFPWPLRDE